MFTRIIVHKIKYFFTFILFTSLIITGAKSVYATQVRSLTTDPGSPAYNQEFRCAISLDQDDHRNAYSLMPLNAPAGTFPWDVCTIDNVSGDKLTRFYKCIANQAKKVPGPGNYQIVVWNFTGDGETGKVIYSRPIAIVGQPPPAPTSPPKPTPIPTVPPEPTDIVLTQIPPSPAPEQEATKVPLPTQKVPTIIEFSISNQESANKTNEDTKQKENAPFKISLPKLPSINFPSKMISQWGKSILNGTIQTVGKTKRTVLQPFIELVQNFMKEANY